MDTWEIITAAVGALVFVGLWLDKIARKRAGSGRGRSKGN